MTKLDLLLLGIISGIIICFYGIKYWKHLVLQRKFRKAKKGELAAVKLLEDRGYNIIEAQKEKRIVTWVDNKPHYNTLRVDYIVRKGGKTFIAEVKTGKKVTKPTHTETRRQLLEYYLAFNPHGIILVDMEKKKLHNIAFDISGRNYDLQNIHIFLLAGLLGLVFGWFLYKCISGGNIV